MSTKLTGAIQITSADLTSNSSTQEMELGSLAYTADGRSFRYCKAGGTALVPGKLQQAAAEITNHQNLTPAAAAIGATSVTVTLGNTAVTANYYANGYMVGTVTPGQGYMYKIKSHPAADASATVVLTLEDPLLVALTTNSRVDLVANQYQSVIVNPTTATSNPVGVAVYPITAAYYGWLQVGGVCPVLVDDQTVVVGTNVAASNQAAGACEPHTGVQAIVGRAVTGGATTEYVAVNLAL